MWAMKAFPQRHCCNRVLLLQVTGLFKPSGLLPPVPQK
ncbi:hypothetical protein ECP02989421_4945 [Escherichia coli P0298942.1]|nr:hypothetical protein ECP02989421_4945 [Escherichia coli P0298942.1]